MSPHMILIFTHYKRGWEENGTFTVEKLDQLHSSDQNLTRPVLGTHIRYLLDTTHGRVPASLPQFLPKIQSLYLVTRKLQPSSLRDVL